MPLALYIATWTPDGATFQAADEVWRKIARELETRGGQAVAQRITQALAAPNKDGGHRRCSFTAADAQLVQDAANT